MIRRAILLGFYSVGGQVLLLREQVASLNGDELFISTALFGWLLAVAIGAYLGGRKRGGAHGLFLPAAILLPVTLLLTRFSPMITGHMVGELIPFTTAASISVVVMLPVGMISGWMFPAITRQHQQAESSIVRVYLLEGIGAFIGGLAIVFIVGISYSALMMAVTVSLIVLAVEYVPYGRTTVRQLLRASMYAVALPVLLGSVWLGENELDDFQYRPHNTMSPFHFPLFTRTILDTHYGRQAILWREGDEVLLNDGNVEAVYPDLSTVENLVIAPLPYYPGAGRVLYLGRPEYGAGELADHLPGVYLAGLDPRKVPLRWQPDVIDAGLFERLMGSDTNWVIQHESSLLPSDNYQTLNRIIWGDPVGYFTRGGDTAETFDIVIISTGNLGSYRSNRLITPFFVEAVRRRCSGVLMIHTPYDTDNMVSDDERTILATVYNVLSESFESVDVWPGTSTIFFASDNPANSMLPYDTIIARIEALEYEPQFVSADYLIDRLSDFKRRRLMDALADTPYSNSFERPQLIHRHLLYQSNLNSVDRAVLTFITKESLWTVLIAAVVVLVTLVASLIGGRHRYGLFLFFVAGAVSLSLELIVFYTFQSLVGALYSQMAVLIGTFMLGLAVGTFAASMIKTKLWGFISLPILLALAIGFRMTYESLAQAGPTTEPILLYHMLFLFVMAAATGALFVGATRHYYDRKPSANRGLGYAFEIGGSSVGALFTTAILLPAIGLNWLLTGIAVVIGLAFAGLFFKR